VGVLGGDYHPSGFAQQVQALTPPTWRTVMT
jgi:hypothetical protein